MFSPRNCADQGHVGTRDNPLDPEALIPWSSRASRAPTTPGCDIQRCIRSTGPFDVRVPHGCLRRRTIVAGVLHRLLGTTVVLDGLEDELLVPFHVGRGVYSFHESLPRTLLFLRLRKRPLIRNARWPLIGDFGTLERTLVRVVIPCSD